MARCNMKIAGFLSNGLLLIGFAVIAGCGTQKPSCATVVYPAFTPDFVERVRQARENSMAKLQTYRVGVTTREAFLSDCWRSVSLTEPLGGVGISDYRTHFSYTNWVILRCEFTLGYLELPNSRRHAAVPICTLTFDDFGKLESMRWIQKTLPK